MVAGSSFRFPTAPWSADGLTIAFCSNRDGLPGRHVIDVRTGKTTELIRHPSDSYPAWY